MKETFRDWSPKERMVITYKDPENQKVKLQVVLNGKLLLSNIMQTLQRYAQLDLKLTSREIYYSLVKANIIPNAEEVYKRMCNFITDARYGGYLDWDIIEDRGRRVYMHAEWDDVEDLIASAVASYRLKRWEHQYYYLEMYCEKEAGEGKLKPVADKYHIHFGANKGYSGASAMYNMAQRIKEQIRNGKIVKILYFGDHDPSGLDMIRDIKDRLTEFLIKGDEPIINPEYGDITAEEIEEKLQIVPVALNMVQIKKYNCPPNPAKIKDPRAVWYIKKYGKVSWELDALDPDVLINLAENSIQEYLDLDDYNAYLEREKKEIKALREFGENYNKKENEKNNKKVKK